MRGLSGSYSRLLEVTNTRRTYVVPQYSYLEKRERYCHELAELFRQNFQDQLPSVIWQYTTAENLSKIVESNQLWFRHVSNLNDEREVLHSAHLSKVILSAHLTNDCYSQRVRRLLQAMKGRLFQNNRESTWYSASFSKAEDDGCLWKRYGDRGKGIAIGFHTSELIKFLSPSPIDRVFPVHIIYSEKEAINFGSLLLCHGIEAFNRDFAEIADDEAAISEFILNWGIHIDVFSVAFKETVNWQVEKEFRLARSLAKASDDLWKASKSSQSDSRCEALPICSITVGPDAPDSRYRATVDFLAQTPHSSIPVFRSKHMPEKGISNS